MMLRIVPTFQLVEKKTELIFLVDRSGSMRGARNKQARQALKVNLHLKRFLILKCVTKFYFTCAKLLHISSQTLHHI